MSRLSGKCAAPPSNPLPHDTAGSGTTHRLSRAAALHTQTQRTRTLLPGLAPPSPIGTEGSGRTHMVAPREGDGGSAGPHQTRDTEALSAAADADIFATAPLLRLFVEVRMRPTVCAHKEPRHFFVRSSTRQGSVPRGHPGWIHRTTRLEPVFPAQISSSPRENVLLVGALRAPLPRDARGGRERLPP